MTSREGITMEATPAIDALRARVNELDSEYAGTNETYIRLRDRLTEIKAEQSALREAIRILGGDASLSSSGPASPDGTRKPDRRPTIGELAIAWAKEHADHVRLRDLLVDLKRYGFRVDQGGLHTYLKGRPDFEHSGPGEFRYLVELK
jgi:hypothetical protein